MREKGRVRVFLDMDGTLFEWKNVPYYERLYEKGYFKTLKPHQNLIDVLKSVNDEANGTVDFYILSKYLSDSPYALHEKNDALDRYVPWIPRERRIFVPMEGRKSDYIPNGIQYGDILFDDYTKNLVEWKSQGGISVKVLNGVNDSHKSWDGRRIDIRQDPHFLTIGVKMSVAAGFPIKPSIRQQIDEARDRCLQDIHRMCISGRAESKGVRLKRELEI